MAVQAEAISAVADSMNMGAGHVHSKHNMILLGESEIFASHIVYKEPHNFQVILSLNLDEKTKNAYLTAKQAFPKGLFILLLDAIDIKEIAAQEVLTGTILYQDESEQRRVIVPNVTISKDNFRVIYFDELPLSLSPDTATTAPAEAHIESFSFTDYCTKDSHCPPNWWCDLSRNVCVWSYGGP